MVIGTLDTGVGVRKSANKMIVLSGLSFLLAAVQAEPQLIGHRGVFTLREGQVSVDHDISDPHPIFPIFAGVQGRGDREGQRGRRQVRLAD